MDLKYYFDGKEITKAEADQIEKENNEIYANYRKTGNFTLLYNIKFVVVI